MPTADPAVAAASIPSQGSIISWNRRFLHTWSNPRIVREGCFGGAMLSRINDGFFFHRFYLVPILALQVFLGAAPHFRSVSEE